MKIQVRFFASLREAVGPDQVVDMPPGATIAQLRDHLLSQGGAHAEALARTRAIRCACDQKLCDEAQTLREGAEVAFFPPVTGG